MKLLAEELLSLSNQGPGLKYLEQSGVAPRVVVSLKPAQQWEGMR